jgi:predicted TIM-barrel fold metal-dependent hydrolase
MSGPRIIDTDTHVIEAPDLWTARLPESWGDRRLHIEWDPGRSMEMWCIGDRRVKPAWSGAAYGRRTDGFEDPPATRGHAHPATWDIGERVKLMDRWGIEMAVLYPNVAGFTFDPFVDYPDPEISAAHVSAYNDWLLEWIRYAPGRFIPMMAVAYWDMPRATAEVERLTGSGFGGIVTTGAPHQHDLPPLRHPHWDPLWSACQDAGLTVSFHVANGDISLEMQPDRLALEGDDIKEARVSTALYLENAKQTTDLLLSGVLARFPELRFAIVESGMGWVPFVLENVDQRFKRNRVNRQHPEFGDLLPSDLFRRQVFVNFWFEELRDFHVERVGLENLLFETDFPHNTGIYNEHFEDTLQVAFRSQPDEVRRTILWDNPARLYGHALAAQGVNAN